MNETQKPFACAREGCKMAFTNEDHLNVHKKKHDMALHLGIDNQSNAAVADQTPTPTRFIRNCEEVGLFQDLQNVNPFDETFRKATEMAKCGSLHIPDASLDDTLHTPHIFPHIEENNISNFSRNNSNELQFTVTTLKEDDLLKLNNKSSDDLSRIKSDEEIEVLLTDASSDSDELKTTFLVQDIIITNDNTVISKDGLISNNAPTAIPVSNSVTNSDVLPAVVNNLSDIQINTNEKNVIKKNYIVKAPRGISEETIKSKIKKALKNRIIPEEYDSDEHDTILMEEMDSPPLFTPRLMKTPQKRTGTKRSLKIHANNCNISKTRQMVIHEKSFNINVNSGKKNKMPITQSQLDRQREVNRAAQIRSREKKKYWINQMETEIVLLKDEKRELWLENQNLKNEVVWLKTMLLYHKDCPVARDPQIMEEINWLVKTTQEDLQKKQQKQVPTKKMVPIRPNPASLISLTPISNSMLVQVPAAIPTPVLAPFPTPSVSIPIESSIETIEINTLPTLTAKPSIIIPETNGITATMPKLIPGMIPPPTTPPPPSHNSSNAITLSPDSPPRLVINLSDDASSPSFKQNNFVTKSKIIKAKDKLSRRGKRLGKLNAPSTQILKVPNTILPEDNYFILSSTTEIKNRNSNIKWTPS